MNTTNATQTEARRQEWAALHAAVNTKATQATLWHGAKSKAKGRRVQSWTAEVVADFIPEGAAVVIYTSFGHVNGVEGFGRQTFVQGEGRIHTIDADGNTKASFPLDGTRKVRVLVS